MQIGFRNIKTTYAVSIVVSAILAISIVVMSVASILFWGIPYITDINDRNTLENAEMQFYYINDEVINLIAGNSQEQNVLQVSSNDGYLILDENDCDRIVIITSYFDNYNFSTSGLDFPTKNSFTLDWKSVSNCDDVEAYRYDSSANRYNPIDASISLGVISLIEPNEKFCGNMYINLFDGAILFGNISIFDSNKLVFSHSSSQGTFGLSLERGGLLYYRDGSIQIRKSFNIYVQDEYFGIHTLNLTSSQFFSIGKGYDFDVNLKNIGTWVFNTSDIVYNLRLQLYGDNAQLWIDNIIKKYKNSFIEEDQNTLLLSDSSDGDGVKFALLNSIVDVYG